jgi:hypothetical protein
MKRDIHFITSIWFLSILCVLAIFIDENDIIHTAKLCKACRSTSTSFLEEMLFANHLAVSFRALSYSEQSSHCSTGTDCSAAQHTR